MAIDKAIDSARLGACCTAEANAIRAKTGGSSPIAYDWANGKGFADAIAAIGGSNWAPIGQTTIALTEYTDTTQENTDTQINISSTDYAWILVFIVCDSAIDTSSEWGMTAQICSRRTNGKISAFHAMQQFGYAALSGAAIAGNPSSVNNYGVWVQNDSSTVVFARKCHASNCPKIRAGNYTVKVYGLTGI